MPGDAVVRHRMNGNGGSQLRELPVGHNRRTSPHRERSRRQEGCGLLGVAVADNSAFHTLLSAPMAFALVMFGPTQTEFARRLHPRTPPVPCEPRALAGEGLEAADDDVAVERVELDQALSA
jgi:hypothetical protein